VAEPAVAGTAGAGATPAAAETPPQPEPAAPGPAPVSPPPRPAEALDAGSLVGTVIRGRLQALVQAIANFFRRLFGRRRTS
jgi:hypothetical protein